MTTKKKRIRPTQETECIYCKKKFMAPIYKLKIGLSKYCSRSCLGKANYKDQTGPNNPNYKGGISKNNMRYKQIFQSRYPQKAKAHQIVHKAIRSGKLVRQPCEVCGTTARIHAHHEDYSKPLEVRWLCGFHHRELHNSKRVS